MTLVLGGVRSGKTRFAVSLAKSRAEAVAYIATYDASAAGPDGDAEMEARIRQHRKDRPSHWLTVELGDRLLEGFERLDSRITCAVVDELSLAIASWVTKGLGDADIAHRVDALVHLWQRTSCDVIVVSHEAGLGLVPPNALGRRFCEVLGRANQAMAEAAQDVYLMVAGLPMTLKPR